jgi:hypothetical protein
MVSLDRQAPWNEDGDAARSCNALKPCRNVHTIPEDVVRLDNYVADIDAHTESNTPVFRIGNHKFSDAGLESQGRANRFGGARKLSQEPVPGALDDAAAVFGDCRVDGL